LPEEVLKFMNIYLLGSDVFFTSSVLLV